MPSPPSGQHLSVVLPFSHLPVRPSPRHSGPVLRQVSAPAILLSHVSSGITNVPSPFSVPSREPYQTVKITGLGNPVYPPPKNPQKMGFFSFGFRFLDFRYFTRAQLAKHTCPAHIRLDQSAQCKPSSTKSDPVCLKIPVYHPKPQSN